MITIWKASLALNGEQTINLPDGAKPLDVQVQSGNVNLWAEVDASEPTKDFTVWIVGTGHPMPDMLNRHHVGTVQQGSFVWHIYIDLEEGWTL